MLLEHCLADGDKESKIRQIICRKRDSRHAWPLWRSAWSFGVEKRDHTVRPLGDSVHVLQRSDIVNIERVPYHGWCTAGMPLPQYRSSKSSSCPASIKVHRLAFARAMVTCGAS